MQNGTEFTDDQRVFLGDLIGAGFEVGAVASGQSFEWSVDEPLVAALPSGAVLIGPDWEITAGEVRRGIYPKCQWGCLLDPTVLRREDVTIVDAPPSWAATTAPSVAASLSTTTTSLSIAAPDDPITPTTGVVSGEYLPRVGPEFILMGVGILFAVAASFVAAGRSRDPQSASTADLRVLEDDVSEPTKV